MPRPWRITYSGAMYHLTSRGNGRQKIFFGDEDYERLLEQLDEALKKDEVVLYAYVLMPNHFHLLVATPLGNIKRFMQRLNTAYGMYFRYKHNAPGHCFQGRYGAKLVGGDDYIVRLTRYIHLNPVKVARMKGTNAEEKIAVLNGWRWSSYAGYVDARRAEERVNYRWRQLMRRATEKGRRAAYREYMLGMLAGTDEELKKAMESSRYAIGDERFIEEAESDLRDIKMTRYMDHDVIRPKERVLSLQAVEEAVSIGFSVPVEDLHCHGHRAGVTKAAAIELCCRLTGKSQREVGRHFGYRSESSVGKQRSLLARLVGEDKALAARLAQITGGLMKVKS